MIKYSARQLNRLDPNILTYISYGLLYDIVLNMYKPFALKFLERMGGGELHISLYNSLPGLVAIFALIPGSLFIARFAKKKNVTTAFFLASRIMILVLAVIPFLEKSVQPLAFVIILGIMNFPDAISQAALQSFLGENFDGRVRATAISLRTKFGQVLTLFVTLVSGLIIRFVPKTNEQTIQIYQIFFTIAFLISLFEIAVFRKFKEREKENSEKSKPPSLKTIFGAFKNTKYRNFLIPTIMLYFTWHLAWPVCGALQVIKLGANELWFALFAVASGIFTYIGASFWGKKIVRKGNEKMLIVAAYGLAVNILMYSFASNLWILIFINMYNGFIGALVTITLFNGLLEATPDENRVVYIAAYNTLINVSLAVTPLVAYLLMTVFSYEVIFAIDAVLRGCVATFMLFKYLKSKKRESFV